MQTCGRGAAAQAPVRAGRARGEGTLTSVVMTELLFLVEEAPEGGYTAHAATLAIVTEADTLDELRANVREAVQCYFDDDDPARPQVLRLHLVHDEVIAA